MNGRGEAFDLLGREEDDLVTALGDLGENLDRALGPQWVRVGEDVVEQERAVSPPRLRW